VGARHCGAGNHQGNEQLFWHGLKFQLCKKKAQ